MGIVQRLSDWLRERRIRRLRRQLERVSNRAVRVAIWSVMRDEINGRSAEQVRRMEVRRGLL